MLTVVAIMASLSLQLTSCKSQNKTLPEIKEAVRNDALFIQYKESSQSLVSETLAGKISMKGADRSLIASKMAKIGNLDELKALMREAKVVGADEFATLLYTQNRSSKALLAKYPELKGIPKSDLADVLHVDIAPTTTEINNSANNHL